MITGPVDPREPRQPAGENCAGAERRPLRTVDLTSRAAERRAMSVGGYKLPRPLSNVGAPRIDCELEENPVTVAMTLRRNRFPIGSALISTFVHTIILVLLAFIFLQWQEQENVISMTADFNAPPEPKLTQDDASTPSIEVTLPEDNQSLLDDTATEESLDVDVAVPSVSVTEENTTAEQPSEVPSHDVPIVQNQKQPVGGGLEGRTGASRAKLAAERGGSPRSEKAVERGLRWIINHQNPDGSWWLNFHHGPCQKQCRNPGTKESTTAATGLALMALLGAGYTHESGPYQSEIQAGLDYLLSRMRKTYFGGNLQAEGTMYAHGIATIALSEAYAITRDPKLKEPVELAKQYIVTAQHSRGGWRYTPGEPGDMTVTGWQLMALKSCELSDISAPLSTWTKAKQFVGSLGESGGHFFGYRAKGKMPAPTAIGLLMQMYMGWSHDRDELVVGTDYLVAQGVSPSDVYFNYYATLVLHHYGGDSWDRWNEEMRDHLVRTQETNGHADGSWFFQDKHSQTGGRLYTTAMAVMILEVYYRYLPIYEKGVRQ